jgi:hypothetical protein
MKRSSYCPDFLEACHGPRVKTDEDLSEGPVVAELPAPLTAVSQRERGERENRYK